MASFEDIPSLLTPEELLRARNSLQLKAMNDFNKTPEQWAESGDAEIAADVFNEEPELANSYFTFQNDPEKIEEIIKHFEEQVTVRRAAVH